MVRLRRMSRTAGMEVKGRKSDEGKGLSKVTRPDWTKVSLKSGEGKRVSEWSGGKELDMRSS